MNQFCRNIVLNINEQAEKPIYVDTSYWYSARGIAILCGYNDNGSQLVYYITHLDYNPFTGIPSKNRVLLIKSIILALHPDNTTHGIKPGPVVDHLAGNK